MRDQGTAPKAKPRGREGIEGRPGRKGTSWRACVYDKRTGKKIKRTFSGKGALAAAKRWRADMLSDLNHGRASAPSTRTVRQAAEEWLAKAAAGKMYARGRRAYKPSTLRGYSDDLTDYLLDEFGHFKLGDLRRSDVQRFADRLLEGDRDQGPLSPSRVKNIVMPLRVLYRHEMQRDEGLALNPTEGLDLPASDEARDRVATPEEAERLFAVLPADVRAIYGVAFYSGLRCGELQALRWSDVDLAKGVLRVERSWDAKAGPVPPKSKKGRRGVPIGGALRDYLDEQKARTARGHDDLVFGTIPTRPFTPSNIRRRALKAWADRNAEHPDEEPLAPIGLHECRHSYVSWMFAAGHSLEEIGDYVGHSSAYMVDRYRHLLEGHERRSVARQDEYLNRANGTPTDGDDLVRDLRDRLDRAERDGELDRHAVEVRALVDGYLARADERLADERSEP